MPREVTEETFVRAETDRMFLGIAQQAGGVNKMFHFRGPTPLNRQTVVRMNKDTLYSMGVVDSQGGATITVPELPAGRYVSVYLVDNDHYVPFVIYEAGIHQLPEDTKYLGVGLRIQVFDPDDLEELALIGALQDQFVIEAASSDEISDLSWDVESLDALRSQYEGDYKQLDSSAGMQGARGTVNEEMRHIVAAGGWGLFPEKDAAYLNYGGGHDANVCHVATYEVPEASAFWSITVYGGDGYLKNENSVINANNVVLNEDGTFTVHFGPEQACGKVDNRLDVTEGWNFSMRVYLPGESVLDGSYKLPKAVPVT